MRLASAWIALAALCLAGAATADDVDGEGVVVLPQAGPWDLVDDPMIREMMRLDAIAPFEDLAPVWDWRDEKLQAQLDAGLARLALDDDARRHNTFGLTMSLNMLIEFGDAFDYTAADFRQWCSAAGFRSFETIALDGPSSAAIAYK